MTTIDPAQARYIEDLKAPELTADDIPFVSFNAGMLTLVLTRLRHDNDKQGEPVRVVVGRVTIPRQTADTIVGNIKAYLEKNPLIASPQPAPITLDDDECLPVHPGTSSVN
ncbi:hypothetical protein ACELLULO517_07690 [Acidisoma cellulosilytica]|uniref:DUF3467 domain-containing protein n=1 Tax=Acidisoma cellulosilyticum TaxID=2802395 RepID=A0A964E3M8_9PROT|nr:hypothetical protein [Acidisoma cellulosilyticum]MCB8880113.1 hypothetical protein [Acidisoma cellulosilyticum]